MKLIPYTINNVSFLVIKDLYDSQELELIMDELDYLFKSDSLTRDKRYLSTAGNLAERKGVWLDFFYEDRSMSPILNINRKPFANELIRNTVVGLNPYHKHYENLTYDNTLIQYYENDDRYGPHFDKAVFSLVTWFFKEPKKFSGGNFKFNDLDIQFEIENNMCIIFPSFLTHEVEKVIIDEQDKLQALGRFSMTQFVIYDKN
jgi:hypothetical protein